MELESLDGLGRKIAELEREISGLTADIALYDQKENQAAAAAETAYSNWQNNDEKKRKEALEEKISALKLKITESDRLLKVFQTQLEREIKLLESLEDWAGSPYWVWEPTELQSCLIC